MEKTIEIPEGYEARIEDNKVILEQKESEDEKIRKEMIEFLTDGIWRAKEINKVRETQKYAKWIAYLERHKDILRERKQNITANMLEDRIEGIQHELIEFLSNTIDASWVDIIKSADSYAERIKNIIEKQKEQKPVEYIEFDNEFKNQVSHLLASVLNKEHDYTEGFVKYISQSLLEYAKIELKPDEWNKREKLFMKALQTSNARIGQLVEENYRLKEQKPAEWVLPEDFEEAVYKVANFISPFDNQEELRKTSHCFAEQLLSLAKKELGKLAEWSEEDRGMIQSIITGGCVDDKQEHWLRMLPERIYKYLQREQPGKSIKKNCNNCPHCIDRKDQIGWHFKGCFGGKYKGKFIAEIDEYPLQQEMDLEKFTEKIKAFQGRYNHPEIVSIKGAMAFMARMFYMYPNIAREWYDGLPKVTQD